MDERRKQVGAGRPRQSGRRGKLAAPSSAPNSPGSGGIAPARLWPERQQVVAARAAVALWNTSKGRPEKGAARLGMGIDWSCAGIFGYCEGKMDQSSGAKRARRSSKTAAVQLYRLKPDAANASRLYKKRVLHFTVLVALLGCQLLTEIPGGGGASAEPNNLLEAEQGANVISVKIGALLEESDHEQANMFIRTIKMINERSDETIRQLLSVVGDIRTHRRPKALAAGQLKMQNGARFRRDKRAPDLWLGADLLGSQEQLELSELAQVPALLNATINRPDNDSVRRRPRDSAPETTGEQRSGQVLKLEPIIEFLADKHSSLEADNKVCQLIESGVQAIVGPSEGASIQHVQSICDNMEIPYFELRPFLGSPPAPLHYYYSQVPSLAAPLSSSGSSSAEAIGKPTADSGSQSTLAKPMLELGSAESAFLAGPGNESKKQEADDPKTTTNSEAIGQEPEGSLTQQQQATVRQTNQRPANMLGNKLDALTLNLYPPAYLLTSAYIDLISAWNWTSFAIVYEDGNSMIKLQDLFRESSGTWTSKWQIKLFQVNPSQQQQQQHPSRLYSLPDELVGAQLDGARNQLPASNDPLDLGQPGTGAAPNRSEPQATANNHANTTSQHASTDQWNYLSFAKRPKASFRDIFWQIKMSGEHNILLDVKTSNLYDALKQAQQVGCMTERYSYLISSLDLHTIDLEDFKYSRTRLTAFSIVQVAKQQQQQAVGGSKQTNNNATEQQSHGRASRSSPGAHYEDDVDVDDNDRLKGPFDERYLEKLGVHVIQHPEDHQQLLNNEPFKRSSSQIRLPASGRHLSPGNLNQQHDLPGGGSGGRLRVPKFRLSPSVVLERSGSFLDPQQELNRDWTRREMLLSSPASMGLLPSVDRDNEQRLFEFFVQQQERNLSRVRLSTSSAIIHDSLLLYMLGLNELDPAGSLLGGQQEQQAQQTLSCSLNSQPLSHGSSLLNYMRQISFTGLTGQVSFDQRGLRTDFKLDMMGMAPDIGLVKVGEWRSAHASSSWQPNQVSPKTDPSKQPAEDEQANKKSWQQDMRPYEDLSRFYETELRKYNKLLADGAKVQVPYTKSMSQHGALLVNEIIFGRLYRELADQVDTLIVTTKLSQPYFMLKETPNKLEGNDQYEGFAVDLVHELSKLVNFKYRWREAADKKYGSKEILPNGTVRWNGLIGEIVRGQADLAIVDLTITAQREEAVDFTLPFMNTGISILFKKPTTKVTTLFSFLSPFSNDVWAYVLAAYCGISANLFLVGHLSPYEWADPHPCRRHSNDDDEAVLKNHFSLLNSFWFTIGSLMQQGSDLTPRSMSTRTVAGIWYFFTLIMISSYTANLAAFLTVEKVVYPIENVRDLSGQEEIKYGCVESGSTCTFFHDSQIDTYKKINETMRKFHTYVRSNDEGQKRVEEGKFAFFMESASIEYIIERNCNLTQIGGLLDSKGYGLATNKKSKLKRPYRTLLSEGILHLQETGMLHTLKNRWWKERRGGGTCTDDAKGSGVTELSLANVGGVFVVLLGGLGISFLVAIAEFMWRARRSGSTRDKICEEMMNDLKFALACKSSTKPVANRGANGNSANGSVGASDPPPRRNMRQLRREKQIEEELNWHRQLHLNHSSQLADPASPLVFARANSTATNLYQRRQWPAHGYSLQQETPKECNPMLIQAMLKTLTRQQHQSRSLGRLAADEPRRFAAQTGNMVRSASGGRHIELSRADYGNVSDGSKQVAADSMDLSPRERNLDSAASKRLDLEQAKRRHWILAGNQSSQQHQVWPACAGKRRLLFAQQTIDTTPDETLAG